MEAHAAFLRAETGDAKLAEQIKTDYTTAPIDAPTRALLDYAVKVTREQWNCTREDIRKLRDMGFKDEDILDAVQIMALFNYFTRMADGLGVELNAGYATLGAKPGTMAT
jgi:uncharacterized peroxidase-related enzyme